MTRELGTEGGLGGRIAPRSRVRLPGRVLLTGTIVGLAGIVLLSALAGIGTHRTPGTAALPRLTPAGGSPSPIQHVIFVWFENRELGSVLRFYAPYEHSLAKQYALAGQFYSVRHDSEPDYLAATSGADPNGFRTGGYNFTSVGTLVDRAGMSWGSYFESMPKPCDNQNNWSQGYEATHNPFVQYRDVWRVNGTQVYCRAHVQDLNAWNATLASGVIPNYVWIDPNIFHDEHSGSVATGSAWLQTVLTPIINAPWFNHTVIFVTYDEGTSNAGYNGSYAGNLYTVAVSPYARSGYNSSHPYQTYSLLTTTEWLLGLGSTGQNDSWSAYPPMKDLFTFGGAKPWSAPYTVSGTIENATGNNGVGGAHVVVTGPGFANGTDAVRGGNYSLRVPAGNCTMYVTAGGYTNAAPIALTVTASRPHTNVTLVPAPTVLYKISGNVKNASSGVGIAGAQILFSGPSLEKETNANGNGYYSWLLPNGTYTETVSAPGYVTQTRTVTIAGAPDRGVNFSLKPG